jgi:hypothetical protein
MARPQVFGRQRRGTVRGRDAEFPSAPLPVSSLEKSRDALPRSPQHHYATSPSSGITLPDRPSTSGGISTRKAVAQKVRQETQDDLHFHHHPGNEVTTTYYDFPLPSTLLTPSPTPRNSPPREASPDYSDSEETELSLAPMEIGMALGSPSHQPVAWNSAVNYQRQEPRQIGSPESMDTAEDWRQTSMQAQPKVSKWKRLFGGGKKTTQPDAFYKVQPERADSTGTDPHYTTFPSPPSSVEGSQTRDGKDTERPRTRGRTNTIVEKKSKQKPEIKRSQTAPLNFEFASENQSQQEAPKRSNTMTTPEIQLDGGPMLNVDSPRIELERYSVMFGSLLGTPNSNTSSSLLARRQATLDKLKLVNEAIAEHVCLVLI